MPPRELGRSFAALAAKELTPESQVALVLRSGGEDCSDHHELALGRGT